MGKSKNKANLHDRGFGLLKEPNIISEILDSKCGRHDDQFQRFSLGLPSRYDTGEDANQDVRKHTALVGFINYDDRVLLQGWVLLR